MKIAHQPFADAWQASDSPEECATRTGYSARYCSQRASRMRAAGVPLKKHKGGVSLSSVEVLDPTAARAVLVASVEDRVADLELADQVAADGDDADW